MFKLLGLLDLAELEGHTGLTEWEVSVVLAELDLEGSEGLAGLAGL